RICQISGQFFDTCAPWPYIPGRNRTEWPIVDQPARLISWLARCVVRGPAPSPFRRTGVAPRPIGISADSHVNIPDAAFAEYFPAHLKDRAPRVERGADKDTVVFEGTRSEILLIAAVAGRPYEEYRLAATRLGEGAVGGYDPVERLKDMDVD